LNTSAGITLLIRARVTAAILTEPIVFGEDVTFQCLFNGFQSSQPITSIMWIKEPNKVPIANGDINVSTNKTKYTPTLYKADIPNQSDVIFNQTSFEPTQLYIWIQKIYPQPNCTVYYKGDDITRTIKYAVELGITLYSVKMEIVLNECIGSLNISCLIGSRHFTVSNYIQQCCKGKVNGQ
ncbi:hypothetical protein AM593_07580, partial [Mytilus galloprovincialis]